MRGFSPLEEVVHVGGISTLWRTWSFLSKPHTDSFLPHAEFGVVPEEVLAKFVEDRADTFLAATRLMSKLEYVDRAKATEEVVQVGGISTLWQTRSF